LGTSTIIRLKDFQIANWEPTNILEKRIHDTPKIKNNFQANVLLLAQDHGISYHSSNLLDLFDWKGGTISIKEVLNDQKHYNKAIKSLSRSNLMYIDQLIDPSNKTLLNWQVLISLINRNNKGRPPLWYQYIKEKITTNTNNNQLKRYYANLTYANNYHEWTHQISKDNRTKEWIVSQSSNQEILWGKIIDKGNHEKNLKKATITHYITNTSDSQELILTPCNGCTLKDHKIDSSLAKCGLKLNKKEIRGIKFLNKRKSKRNNISHNNDTIIDNINKELTNNKIPLDNSTNQLSQLLTPSIHSFDFGSCLIYKWISTELYQKQLIQAYENNLFKDPDNIRSTYEFYTDGSLKNRGNENTAMGSSWIQTQGPNPNSNFKAGSKSWPSSSKAKALAILTALLTVSPGKNVDIYTDSQTCINTFDKIMDPHPKFTKKKLLKIKNWSIWTKISEIQQSKDLLINLNKVKVHSGNYFNESADTLAKEALNCPILEFTLRESGPINILPLWEKTIIDIPIRDFIKELNVKTINLNWASQKRNSNIFYNEIQHE